MGTRMQLIRALSGVCVLVAGCASDDNPSPNNPPPPPRDGGTRPDPYAPPHDPNCKPLNCYQTKTGCGEVPDGCGRWLNCGPCKDSHPPAGHSTVQKYGSCHAPDDGYGSDDYGSGSDDYGSGGYGSDGYGSAEPLRRRSFAVQPQVAFEGDWVVVSWTVCAQSTLYGEVQITLDDGNWNKVRVIDETGSTVDQKLFYDVHFEAGARYLIQWRFQIRAHTPAGSYRPTLTVYANDCWNGQHCKLFEALEPNALTIRGGKGPTCTPRSYDEAHCRDGVDDDCDGHTDCEDSDCYITCNPEPRYEDICDDGRDNDYDHRTDCEDTDCDGKRCGPYGATCRHGQCGSPEVCNGRDDDYDGTTDEGCPSGIVFGPPAYGPTFGHDSGARYERQCPAGYALSGFEVGEGYGVINYIAPICARADLLALTSHSPYAYSVRRGSQRTLSRICDVSQTRYVRHLNCPGHQWVTGLETQSGGSLGRMRLRCGSLQIGHTGGSWRITRHDDGWTPWAGGAGYSNPGVAHYTCVAPSVGTRVRGTASHIVNSLSLDCSTPRLVLIGY